MGLAALWLLLALASAAHFVFETAVVPSVSKPGLVLGGALASALMLLLASGFPRSRDLKALGIQRGALAFAAGVLGIALAPALVIANRYSDAPAGTVVAFWTLAGWGLLLVVASAALTRHPVRASAALLAVVGCMGILGSWERPSSFSLLVRFPAEEAAFVIAGVAWAAFAVITGTLAREHSPRAVYSLAAAGGLLSALAWAIPAAGWDPVLLLPPADTLPAVIMAGLVTVLTVHLTRKAGAHLPGTALLVTPALITTLLVVEQATGTFGPRPIIVQEAWWGAAVAAVGIAAVLVGMHRRTQCPHTTLRIVGIGLAALFAAVALFALTQPGVAVAVRGTNAAGAIFTADFTLSAFRTVGGWLSIAASTLALAVWLQRPARGVAALVLLGTVVAAAAHATLAFTPLHTWMNWIPAEVQHDYGTEYATIMFSEVSTTAQVVGIMGACLGLVVFLVWCSLTARGAGIPSEGDSGGRG